MLDAVPPAYDAVALEPLPAVGDDFPDEITIDFLKQKYEPSVLPHRKIVERLDAIVRGSKLAVRFHGSGDISCSGCHHQSPAGDRPPPCRSCHAGEADATRDKPALLAAYHRQCIGCHQRMAIGHEGCTDCHASKEERQ
jgi:hypothetical protein